MNALLDTMSTETGERCAQAAQKTALETVIEDTEAELAKLQRSKVASMIALYQGPFRLPAPCDGPQDCRAPPGVRFTQPASPVRAQCWACAPSQSNG